MDAEEGRGDEVKVLVWKKASSFEDPKIRNQLSSCAGPKCHPDRALRRQKYLAVICYQKLIGVLRVTARAGEKKNPLTRAL